MAYRTPFWSLLLGQAEVFSTPRISAAGNNASRCTVPGVGRGTALGGVSGVQRSQKRSRVSGFGAKPRWAASVDDV